MIKKTTTPTRIPVPGNKLIEEFVGRVHTQTDIDECSTHDCTSRLGRALSNAGL